MGVLMIDVIIPIYKPDKEFYKLLERVLLQTIVPQRIIIMNTEAEGFMTKDIINEMHEHLGRHRRFNINLQPSSAKQQSIRQQQFPGQQQFLELQIEVIAAGKTVLADIISVNKNEFDHGKTRHKASKFSKADFIIYMTQDALPKDKYLIERMIRPFEEEQTAVVYARQTAKEDADAIEIYTRIFNYPEKSIKKTKEDISLLGVKTFFSSNVCAAYRRTVYNELGGFNKKMIFNEDMLFAANVINNGYAVYYNAEAVVYHSHNYSWIQQFKRNFDIGVSQKEHSSVFEGISSEKEGITLVKNLLNFLAGRKEYFLAADFIIQCVFRYAGYFLGRHYNILPKKLILISTMNKNYWNK